MTACFKKSSQHFLKCKEMRRTSELHRLGWTLCLCASIFLESLKMMGSVEYSDRLKWFWIGAFNCQMSNTAVKYGASIGWNKSVNFYLLWK